LAVGEFYDLMWANVGRPNMERCYAFLRHTSDEQLLITAWFGAEQNDTTAINLHIPQHALTTMGLPLNSSCKLTPLLHAGREIIMGADGELTINFTDFTYEIYCFSKK
jgi:hypothetical protein